MADEDVVPWGTYATPEHIKAMREYANALLSGSGQQDVKHWTQLLGNTVNRAVGAYKLNKVNDLQRAMEKHVTGTSYPTNPESENTEEKPKLIKDVDEPRNRTFLGGPPSFIQSAVNAAKNIKLPGLPKLTDTAPIDKNIPIADTTDIPTWRGGMDKLKNSMLSFSGGEPSGMFSNRPPDPDSSSAMAFGSGAGGHMPSASREKREGGVLVAGDLPPGAVFTPRPKVSREQFINAMSAPDSIISADQKKMITQQYYDQFKPQEVEVPGGKVIFDKNGNHEYKPDIKWGTVKSSSGAEAPIPGRVDASGAFSVGPGGGGTSAPERPAPGPEPTDIPDTRNRAVAPKAKGEVPSDRAKGGPLATPPVQQNPDKGKPWSTPFKGATEGPDGLLDLNYAANEKGPKGTGLLASVPDLPEIIKTGSEGKKPVQDAKTGTEGKSAQALPPQITGIMDDMDRRGLEYKQKELNQQKDSEEFSKRHAKIAEAGTKAAMAAPKIDILKQLIEDPHFVQGFASGIRLDINRIRSLFGDDVARANQTFEKLVSENILNDMGVYLSGLGQVRVAEINLLNKAAASPRNTLDANRALLELTARSHKMSSDISKISDQYADGIRWDKNGKVIRDKSGQPIIYTDRSPAGLDAAIKAYIERNPIATKDQIRQYEDIFKRDASLESPKKEPKPTRGQQNQKARADKRASESAPVTPLRELPPHIQPD